MKHIWGPAVCPVVRPYYIWITGRRKGDWCPGQSLKKKERKRESFKIPFLRPVIPRRIPRAYISRVAQKRQLHKIETLFCHQVGQIWSCRALVFFAESLSWDLQFGHGFRACSFENKRKTLFFHEQIKVATLFWHQVGQICSYGALVFFGRNPRREIDDWGMVSGLVLLK